MRHRLSLAGRLWNQPILAGLLVLGVSGLWGCGGQQPVAEPNKTTDQQSKPGEASNRVDAQEVATRDGDSQKSDDDSNNGPQAEAAESPPHEARDQAPASDERPIVHVDSQGRKWIGEIPYDVWFEDPLAVAADTSRVSNGRAESDPAGSHTESGKEGETRPAADNVRIPASSPEWQTIIPAAVLQAEVDSIRDRLKRNLSSVRNYNRGYKDVRIDGATLAALCAIAAKHPDPVPWKQDALTMRDLGARIAENADGLGKKAFDATREPFDRLAECFDNPDAQAAVVAEAGLELSESADRSGLMQRIERAQQWLVQNVKGNAVSGKRAETALQEATLLEALARVIADPSYVFADEEVYSTQAAKLAEAAHDVILAVPAGQIEQATSALDRIQKTCNTCHKDYRF